MLATAIVLLLGLAQGQVPAPESAPAGRAAGLAALESARKSLELNDSSRALEHLQRARAALPDSIEPIELGLQASSANPDEHLLWSYAWLAAASDDKGESAARAELRGVLDEPVWLKAVIQKRAAAVSQLERFARQTEATRGREAPFVARWARQLASDLAATSPALRKTLPAYDAWLVVKDSLAQSTLRALEKQMQGSLDSGRTAEGIRAARVLRGLAVQSEFKDLQGPRPKSLAAFAKSAGESLARARAQWLAREPAPWSVDDLDWLSDDECDAFTRAHPDFGLPGAALSPGARYRIETDCGAQTLRGVAASIEQHHARLAAWYGSDPFLTRQGLVRIVPEASGLESEGAPFWWAGGFQSGDVTTLRFSCGTIEGLGHGLTHELTHRFDGALYPGIPAWLAEGRAVWTGAAYARAIDTVFVARHASFGTIEAAFIKGYGTEEKLDKLVSNKLEDYRDNYTAGYALFVYLSTWDLTQKPVYAARLAEYMKRCATVRLDPRVLFEQSFCDGKEGRAADFAVFSADFAKFIQGFYWRDRKPFTDAYASEAGPGGGDAYVYDSPTWVWSRGRAEPWFGQGQALEAARVLALGGNETEALDAYAWALSVDGRSPRAEHEFEALCARTHQDSLGWCLRQARRFPASCAADSLAPFHKQLPQLRELESALLAARDASLAAGHSTAAQQFAAERERLAAHAGFAAQSMPTLPAALKPRGNVFGAPARWLCVSGFVEDGLTGYEEKRVRDLWYVEPNGDVQVGRARPRSGTGQVDRGATQQDAFTRSKEWNLPGAWRFDARVRFTTSYAGAAIVIGHQRREQGVRFSFSGGDFLVAIGASEKEPSFETLGWNLSGGFERDGAIGGGTTSGAHAFDGSRTSFELSLIVDGPRVDAFIEGEHVGNYCNTDATPIQGYVGFATSMGAIVVQNASVRRLDSECAVGPPRMEARALALQGGPSIALRGSVGALLHGFDAPSQGALLVIVPTLPALDSGVTGGDAWLARIQRAGEGIADELERSARSQPVWLCVPRGMPDAAKPVLDALRARFDSLGVGRAGVIEHDLQHDREDVASFGRTPWVIFVDAYGIIRNSGSYSGLASVYENQAWRHSLDAFRENGLPPRDLPAVKKQSETEKSDH